MAAGVLTPFGPDVGSDVGSDGEDGGAADGDARVADAAGEVVRPAASRSRGQVRLLQALLRRTNRRQPVPATTQLVFVDPPMRAELTRGHCRVKR